MNEKEKIKNKEKEWKREEEEMKEVTDLKEFKTCELNTVCVLGWAFLNKISPFPSSSLTAGQMPSSCLFTENLSSKNILSNSRNN